MEKEIQEALDVVSSGGTILYPTDTIWGLGCNAQDAAAVKKIYELKNRAESKSLILLLDDDRNLKKYVKEVPEVAWDLLDHADSPMTIVYPGAINLPKEIIAEDGSIAIRICKATFAKQLIRKMRAPLVSTSANISGSPSPRDFDSISEEILKGVDHVVNLPASKGLSKASSIIKLGLDGEINIIRK